MQKTTGMQARQEMFIWNLPRLWCADCAITAVRTALSSKEPLCHNWCLDCPEQQNVWGAVVGIPVIQMLPARQKTDLTKQYDVRVT
jgi:hypothetical protein